MPGLAGPVRLFVFIGCCVKSGYKVCSMGKPVICGFSGSHTKCII